MKLNKFYLVLCILTAAVFTGCKDDDNASKHHFENKLYISSAPVYSDLFIKDDVTEATRTISTRLAMPAIQDITVTFAAAPSMAAQYNMIYGDSAGVLPEECYEIPKKVITIKKGDVSGDDIVVKFVDTNELDGNERYVLPVTIANVTNIGLLETSRTVYFVFKGAALINVVANIAAMHFPVNWSSSVSMNSIDVITVEALIRSSNWEASRDNPLSSIFGREGVFLIRIGDSDRPRNQLQMVAPGGNWPAPNSVQGLPINEWVHIALVYDTNTRERIYYLNGDQVAYDTGASSTTFSLSSGCYIGKAWDDSRWFPGEISELRIWNLQRTAQQIKDNPYYVNPATVGLTAYWKFNEGEGNVIHDASGNGTTITGSATPKWVDVEIPKIGK